MALEDNLLEVYTVGTEDEVENYVANNSQDRDLNKIKLNISYLVESGIFVTLVYINPWLAVAGTPIAIDVIYRFGARYYHDMKNKKKDEKAGIKIMAPGLIGMVRDYMNNK